jgi:hypothetical protein
MVLYEENDEDGTKFQNKVQIQALSNFLKSLFLSLLSAKDTGKTAQARLHAFSLGWKHLLVKKKCFRCR